MFKRLILTHVAGLALVAALSLADAFVPLAVANEVAETRSNACGQLFARTLEVMQKTGEVARLPLKRLESAYARLLVGGTFDTFSFDIFEEMLRRFAADPALRPSSGMIEEEMAYWENALSKLGPKGAQLSLVPLLKSDDWMTRYEVHRAIRGEGANIVAVVRSALGWNLGMRGGLNLEKGVSEAQIRRLMGDLYLIRNVEIGPVLRDLFGKDSGKLLDEKLRNLAERELAIEGLKRFLEHRGLLAEPTVADRIRAFMESESFGLMLTLSLNLKFAGRGLPAYVPRADFLREIRKLGPDLYDKGLDELWPRLKLEFRSKQEAQAYYAAVRSAWVGTGMVLGGVAAYATFQRTREAKKKPPTEIVDELDQRVRHDAGNAGLPLSSIPLLPEAVTR